MSGVTVVTPTLPERGDLLARCVAGVAAQTVEPAEHLIGVDWARTGHGARIRNRLIRAATTEYVALCDDDDWWLPHHLETLLGAASEADVVVAFYELEDHRGEPPWNARHSCDPADFEWTNWTHPSAMLLRREAVLDLGGFPDPTPELWDDWGLWQRLYRAGARFACVHEVTNVKGVHTANIAGPRSA